MEDNELRTVGRGVQIVSVMPLPTAAELVAVLYGLNAVTAVGSARRISQTDHAWRLGGRIRSVSGCRGPFDWSCR